MEALIDAVGAGSTEANVIVHKVPDMPQDGPLDPRNIGNALAHLFPEDAIVVDEGGTCGGGCTAATRSAAPHDFLMLTGGAIGFGLPCATGAAVACPDRPVISLQADGSGMYTNQALWTQAREQLNVTTIIFANQKYSILQIEFGPVS